MKKVVRTVWISALSGLAFLAGCCTQNGLTRKERKQLAKEREEVMIALERSRNYEVEGPLDDYLSHQGEIYALEDKLDSIKYRLGSNIDLDRNVRRRQLLYRIDSLNYLIDHYSPPCIYGSPEMMEERAGQYFEDNELDGYQSALKAAQKELEDLDRTETDGPEIQELLYGGPNLKIIPIEPELIIVEDSVQNENQER